MKKYLYKSLSLFFILLTSCTVSPVAPVVEEVVLPGGTITGVPNTGNFSSQLKAYGVNLTLDDLNMLRKYQSVIPNGKWYSPDSTTGESENLNRSYVTLNRTFKDFPVSNTQDYLNRAIQFAGSGNFYAKKYFDIEYYKLRQKVLVIKSDPQTNEFVIIHIDGSISNYQISKSVGLPRYILVPENL